MADGIASGSAGTVLTTVFSSTPSIQLHTGAPGPSGTNNVATNNSRITTGTISGSPTLTNSSAITWASVPATETYTDFSLWVSGTFVCSGSITGGAVTSGGTFTITAGSLTIAVTPIAS